jgi:two-component system sensor histidine kinase KdpD
VLLLVVSVLAMVFTIRPILVAATLSAIVWNFFFIPPIFTFEISNTEDLLLFLMYFTIALLNAALGSRIRNLEQKTAQEAEKAKTILLYDTLFNALSHELKTPIATILASTEVLKSNAIKLNEHQRNELFNELELAGERLNKQINNLLQMSKADSGTISTKPQWTDLSEFIYNFIDNNYKGNEARIQVFVPNSFPFVKIDTALLTPVFSNLIDNALLYTPVNNKIEICLNWNSGKLQITISDTGPGFPKHEIEKVFEKFYRLPNTTQKGTGLGLSIVRGLLTAHGGSIQLTDNKPQGAVFTITLPAESSSINLLSNE